MANPNNNPCYNEQTKTDCPRRHAGCAVDCPEWARYFAEKEERYKQRVEDNEIRYAMGRKAMERTIYNQRRNLRDRSRKT